MDLRRYFEISIGSSPIILSCVHGGFKKPKRIPNKLKGPQIPDENTYFIAKQIINKLKSLNINIYYILNKVHRSKVDLNRPPHSKHAFNQLSDEARNIHHLFHDQLTKFAQDCILNYNRCLIIDLHGFTKPQKNYPDVIFGHVFGNTLSLFHEPNKEDCARYWGCFQLHQEMLSEFSLDDGLALTDFNLSYSGGYITQQFYNKKKINAIQIEISKRIRLDVQLCRTFIDCCGKAILNIMLNI